MMLSTGRPECWPKKRQLPTVVLWQPCTGCFFERRSYRPSVSTGHREFRIASTRITERALRAGRQQLVWDSVKGIKEP